MPKSILTDDEFLFFTDFQLIILLEMKTGCFAFWYFDSLHVVTLSK